MLRVDDSLSCLATLHFQAQSILARHGFTGKGLSQRVRGSKTIGADVRNFLIKHDDAYKRSRYFSMHKARFMLQCLEDDLLGRARSDEPRFATSDWLSPSHAAYDDEADVGFHVGPASDAEHLALHGADTPTDDGSHDGLVSGFDNSCSHDAIHGGQAQFAAHTTRAQHRNGLSYKNGLSHLEPH